METLREVAEVYRDSGWRCVITSNDRRRQVAGTLIEVGANGLTVLATHGTPETFRYADVLELAPMNLDNTLGWPS